MNLSNVYEYFGQHSITFTVDGVSKNTWTDWGLIPSSRFSEPINGVWSQVVETNGINGQANLVRAYPYSVVNSSVKMEQALREDNRNSILAAKGYDLLMPSNGSFSFIIADQTVSYFQKRQEITNYMHGKSGTVVFADDPGKIYTVRLSVESFDSGSTFSGVSISYSIINET